MEEVIELCVSGLRMFTDSPCLDTKGHTFSSSYELACTQRKEPTPDFLISLQVLFPQVHPFTHMLTHSLTPHTHLYLQYQNSWPSFLPNSQTSYV
jgi:hypothetical protein